MGEAAGGRGTGNDSRHDAACSDVLCIRTSTHTRVRARVCINALVRVRVKGLSKAREYAISQQAGQPAGAALPATLPAGWREAVDDKGRAYYVNNAIGKTQWERPQARMLDRSAACSSYVLHIRAHVLAQTQTICATAGERRAGSAQRVLAAAHP